MEETTTEVRVIRVDCICPNCEKSPMRPIGVCNPTSIPMYPHKCKNCGQVVMVHGKSYPYIDYEEIIKPEISIVSGVTH